MPVPPPPKDRVVTVIAEARPYWQTTLVAKITGYVGKKMRDTGDRVRKGDLLAVVESPESTENYRSARADAANQRQIADRYRPLLAKKLVSAQEAEQAFTNARVAETRARSLGVVNNYQELHAPFDGTVTARLADPGTLAANSQPIFTVAQLDKLRIFAYVDQG